MWRYGYVSTIYLRRRCLHSRNISYQHRYFIGKFWKIFASGYIYSPCPLPCQQTEPPPIYKVFFLYDVSYLSDPIQIWYITIHDGAVCGATQNSWNSNNWILVNLGNTEIWLGLIPMLWEWRFFWHWSPTTSIYPSMDITLYGNMIHSMQHNTKCI